MQQLIDALLPHCEPHFRGMFSEDRYQEPGLTLEHIVCRLP